MGKVLSVIGFTALFVGVLYGVFSLVYAQGTVLSSEDSYYCVTKAKPLTIETITVGKWSAFKCLNPGPNGERSLHPDAPASGAAQGSGDAGGGGMGAQQIQDLLKQGLQALTQGLGGQGGAAHQTCIGYETARKPKEEPSCPAAGSTPCNCVLPDTIGGVVPGICFAIECKGTAAAGLGGKQQGLSDPSSGIIGQVLQGVVQGLLGSLMGGGQGQSGGGTQTQFGSTGLNSTDIGFGGSAGLSERFQPSGLENNLVDQILGRLGTGQILTTGPETDSNNLTNQILGGIGGSSEGGVNITNSVRESVARSDSTSGAAPQTNFTPTGDSETPDFTSNAGNETDVSVGFFGTIVGRTTETAASIVGGICSSRPWATSAVAALIPDAVFDNLCESVGFGPNVAGGSSSDAGAASPAVPAPASLGSRSPLTCSPEVVRAGTQVELAWSCGSANLTATAGFTTQAGRTSATVTPSSDSVYGIRCSDGSESLCTVSVINPSVKIWAEPAEVRLGGRTNVFWSSQDTESCTVTGLNFNENGTSGGASTAALTKTTVFTAVCATADGGTVEDTLIVDFDL